MGTVPFFPYWDMALAGAAMIALIVSYTPYIRYWLPAYPLLVAACVLAAGRWSLRLAARSDGVGCDKRSRGRDGRCARAPYVRRVEVFAGLALTALLLFPVVLPCHGLSWDEYAGRISPRRPASLATSRDTRPSSNSTRC